MERVSPILFANTFILLASQKDMYLTSRKLRQLVYLLYREELRRMNRPPFQEEFQKRGSGPVVGSLEVALVNSKGRTVGTLLKDCEGRIEVIDMRVKCFPIIFSTLLVWQAYSELSDGELVKWLTRPGSAWERAEVVLRASDILSES